KTPRATTVNFWRGLNGGIPSASSTVRKFGMVQKMRSFDVPLLVSCESCVRGAVCRGIAFSLAKSAASSRGTSVIIGLGPGFVRERGKGASCNSCPCNARGVKKKTTATAQYTQSCTQDCLDRKTPWFL